MEVRQGKGRKDRVCWLPPSALPAVRDWLAVRGAAPGPLLLPVRKGGRIEDRALSAQAVRDLCRDLARLAATEPFTLHDLRRTWTGDLLDASGDLAIVQQLAGHASPATTLRYDRRPEATRPRAAELLHVPYVAPHPHPMPAAPAGRVPRLLRERRCVAVSVRRYERSSRAEERGR